MGDLRLLIVLSRRGPLLWRGGLLFRLPPGVRDAASLTRFEEHVTLPPIRERYHLAAHPDGGRQLYMVPVRAPMAGVAGGNGGGRKLLKAFLGRGPIGAYSVRLGGASGNAVGDVATIVYAANKSQSTGERGEFQHDFGRPLPKLLAGSGGWQIVGGRYLCTWRGIVG